MSETLTVTEAARNFSDVVNRVFYRGESMELTRGGQVVARLVPAAESQAPTGSEFLAAWKAMSHLGDEAESFSEDIRNRRNGVNEEPESKWD